VNGQPPVIAFDGADLPPLYALANRLDREAGSVGGFGQGEP
jgi:hypothetical protein